MIFLEDVIGLIESHTVDRLDCLVAFLLPRLGRFLFVEEPVVMFPYTE